MKIQNSTKLETPIKDLIKEHIGNETAQGFVRLIETKNVGLKLFWILFLVTSCSLCGYLVVKNLLLYLSYPVYTTSTIVHESPTVFPKVTICNTAIATTEYAFEMVKSINEEISPGISIFNQSQMANVSMTDPNGIFWQVYNLFMVRINSAMFSDANRQKLVHSFDEVLVYCLFNSQSCSSSDFIWRWHPVFGNCYVFNSGFNASGSPQEYKKTSLPGAILGLQLLVYVGFNEKLNAFNTGYLSSIGFVSLNGMYVFVENNTLMKYADINAIGVDGGTNSYMQIHRKFTTKLPKPYSECEIDNVNPGSIDSPFYNLILNTPYQYNQELCVIQCIQQQIIQICNCSLPYYISFYNSTCQTDAESLCAAEIFYSNKLDSAFPICISRCPLECNSTQVTFQMTAQTSSGIGFLNLINSRQSFLSDFSSTSLSVDIASKKFLQLCVFYDSLTYTMSTDAPSMDIVSFFGSIGATFGLLLGINLLSAGELIHVFAEKCLYYVTTKILMKRRISANIT